MRSPQPHPSGITCPKRSATSGGTSRMSPNGVGRVCGWRGNVTSPTSLTGAMLASTVNPSDASTSSAHMDRVVDGPLGCAECAHRRRTGNTKGGDAAPEFVPERRGLELVDPLVQVAVRPDFVPGRKDLRDQLGMPFGDPAKDEERRAGARPVQILQQQPRRQERPVTRASATARTRAAASGPQMWNHSSTSTVSGVGARRRAVVRFDGPGSPTTRVDAGRALMRFRSRTGCVRP